MANYTKTTNFAAKDSLPSGSAGKIIKGTEHDTEYNNIATAIATKLDASGAVTDSSTTTFTNKTIAYASNTLTGVAGTAAATSAVLVLGVPRNYDADLVDSADIVEVVA